MNQWVIEMQGPEESPAPVPLYRGALPQGRDAGEKTEEARREPDSTADAMPPLRQVEP